jgi:hypothetical protein
MVTSPVTVKDPVSVRTALLLIVRLAIVPAAVEIVGSLVLFWMTTVSPGPGTPVLPLEQFEAVRQLAAVAQLVDPPHQYLVKGET